MGFKVSDDIVTMNETLAGMVAQEVADVIYDKYYAAYYAAATVADSNATSDSFDYYSFMRETRATVDAMLEQGQVSQAEAYMEQQRLILAQHGYFIRKLNQAFFAFYGSYADMPGFENPIADDLAALREQSASLAEFVQKASGLTSAQELTGAVG